jgi:septin family protein
MSPSDFDAKPMVLILGQYSVGKTSFIRSLLKQDFPGQRIGPGIVILKHLSDFFFIIFYLFFVQYFFYQFN